MKKILFMMLLSSLIFSQSLPDFIKREIDKGNFSRASFLIDSMNCFSSLTPLQKWYFDFEKDKLNRIKLDFNKSIGDILPYIKKYYPQITDKEIVEFENDRSLEMMIIDGEKKYFSNADKNLFRVNKKMLELKNSIEPPKITGYQIDTYKDIPYLVDLAKNKNERYLNPIKITIKYKVTLKPNVVPDGEIVRAWLPYPKENSRQRDVKLISTNCDKFIIADNNLPHRSIYLEKKVKDNEPTVFEYSVSYNSYAEVNLFEKLKFNDKNLANQQELKPYLTEMYPHIVFSEKIKKLSVQIVGNEKDKLKIVKKIYEWIDANIPWASAREYSTIDCIPEYVIDNKHGDCGQVSLLFITLCRLNGIPAKWQSGWMIHPNEINLHDWAEIYIEPYGWIPVDQSFGIHKFDDINSKYFFLGSVDNYHLIVNDDISKDFYPAKIYPRSETVDFQRGELEWRGGNIYFDKWRYKMEVSYEK